MLRSIRIPLTLALCALAATRSPALKPVLPHSTLFTHVKLYPVSAPPVESGWLLIEGDKIAGLGSGEPPAETAANANETVDLTGKVLMPGLVDPHSHLGVYRQPESPATSDGNEATSPVTAEVRALDSLDPNDPGIYMTLAAGTTTAQILPGSANAMGGQAAVVKLRPGVTAEAMLLAGARPAMKMAFGENPKRVYGSRGEIPSTRMGHMAVLRAAFAKARDYQRKVDRFKAGKAKEPPERDLRSEAIAEMLRGERWAQVHCYTVGDFMNLFRLQDEFGFKIGAVHHALEAWMIPREFVKRNIVVVTFSDLWGYKWEAFNARADGPKLLSDAGVTLSFHTDHPVIEARDYRFEAAMAHDRGLDAGTALAALTLNPAKALGLEARIGSLEKGKDADLLILDGEPLRMKSLSQQVWLDGVKVFDRADPDLRRRADMLVGAPEHWPAQN